MIDNTSSKPPEDSAPKASGKLLAFSRSKSSESARMSPSSESLGSEESPFALPPIAQPGSPEAPLGLPPAAEPGSAEAPLGLPPNPSQLELLREDRSSLCLMLATPVALIALILWLVPAYDSLPDLMPLHFDAQGNPDRIGERSEIWILPAIGGIVYLVNISSGLLLRLRFKMDFAADLLWGGALMVQVLICLTVWNMTN